MKDKKKKILIVSMIAFVVIAIIATATVLFVTNNQREERQEESEKIKITDPDALPVIGEEFDEDADDDGDMLTNGEEVDLGTKYKSYDSDKDGLSDYYEVKVSSTDPVKYDTDRDGLNDGLEIARGLNPLDTSTDGKTQDGKLKFTETFTSDQCSLTVQGDANIYNIYAEKAEYCNLNGVPGVIGDVYEFYMNDMHFDKATLTLSYNTAAGKNANADNLAIFQLMDDTSFKEVKGCVVDKDNKTISVELEHFSKYFIGDRSVFEKEEPEIQIFLLLDNSGSMYPEELCKGSAENDIDFKRVDFASKLIQMTGDNINYGLAKFTATYYELCKGFDSSKEDLLSALEAIKTEDQHFDGTYIGKSTDKALDNFSTANDVRKFLILLTDGETNESNATSYINDAIEEAQEKNVSIIVIGLGSNIDEEYLKKIATNTNGLYVYANNSDALEKVYERITTALEFNYVDLDGDDIYDHILMADTGFDPKRDGFSFSNFYFNTYYSDEMIAGQCYGMARFCQLYYKGKLLTEGNEVKTHWGGNVFKGQNIEAAGYDLGLDPFFHSETKFASNKVGLYEYESVLTTFNELNKKRVRDKDDEYRLVYSDEVHEFAAEYPHVIGFFDVEIEKKKQPVYYKDEKEYRSYEQVCINLTSNYSELNEKEKGAYNFFMALHNMYTHQDASKNDVDYLDVSTLLSADIGKNLENFDEFIELIRSGTPAIFGACGHAVNAISVYRNIENPNQYRIMLYDNNYTGQTSYVDVLKTKTSFWDFSIESWTNDYAYCIYDSNDTFMNGGEMSPVRFVYSTQLNCK